MHTCTSGKLPSVKLTLSLDFRINGGLGMRGLGRVRELVSRLWVMMREGLGWLGMVRERVGRLGMVREAMAGLVRGASSMASRPREQEQRRRSQRERRRQF